MHRETPRIHCARTAPAYSKVRPRWLRLPNCAMGPPGRPPSTVATATRLPQFRGATPRGRLTFSPTPMTTWAGAARLRSQFNQHAAKLTVAEPNIVRPLKRNPLGAGARQCPATPQRLPLSSRQARCGSHRYKSQPSDIAILPPKAQTSAGPACRGQRAAIHSHRRRLYLVAAARAARRRVLVESTSEQQLQLVQVGSSGLASVRLGCGAHPAIPRDPPNGSRGAPRPGSQYPSRGRRSTPFQTAARVWRSSSSQPFAGVHLAVRQQHQQQRVFYAARDRNNHSRRTRFSLPARIARDIAAMGENHEHRNRPRRRCRGGTLSGCSTMTVTASATVDRMVARPNCSPTSNSTMIQLKSYAAAAIAIPSIAATTPTTVAAPLPPRKSNHTG